MDSRSYRKGNFLSFLAALLVLSAASLSACYGVGSIERNVSTPRGAVEAAEQVFRLDPEKIRFCQAGYSEAGTTEEGDKYTVEENAQWLREHPDLDFPWGHPIRIFRKEAYMDEWGPATRFGYSGDPKNLVNGEIYTLDHRRLVAYRRAGRRSIPVQWADLNAVRDERWKCSTTNGGISIAPQH